MQFKYLAHLSRATLLLTAPVAAAQAATVQTQAQATTTQATSRSLFG